MTLIELLWFGLWTFLGAIAGLAVACVVAPGRTVVGEVIGGIGGLVFALVGIPFLGPWRTRRKCKEGEANRVGGGVAPPASHTTVHAGPRTAVPGSPCGRSSHSFSATVTAARKLSRSASTLRDKTPDGRVCLPSSALPE